MKNVAIHGAALLVLTLGTFGRQGNTPPPSIADYQKWTLITPQPVDMAPSIAMSCIGPGPITRTPANPHPRTVFRVYVNSVGKAAMKSKKPVVFPVGSVIVKEKFDIARQAGTWEPAQLRPGTKPSLLTVMIKREKGYNTKNGDWQYATTNAAAAKLNFERLEHCASCHQGQSKADFVFRGYGNYMR